MATKLCVECKAERYMIDLLRETFEKKIAENGWDNKVIAKKLGLATVGADMFRRRMDWTLEEAMRAATALDIEVEVKAHP